MQGNGIITHGDQGILIKEMTCKDITSALTIGNIISGTASPYTQNLGNGTALTIQPNYITLKFWKRLS